MTQKSKRSAGTRMGAGVSSAVRKAFEERLHPRGARGRFASSGKADEPAGAGRASAKPAARKPTVGETALKTSGVSASDEISVLSKRVRAYNGFKTVSEFVDAHPKGRAYALRKLAADHKKGVIGFKGAESAASAGSAVPSALETRLAAQAVAQPGHRVALVDVRKVDAEWAKDPDFRISPSVRGTNGKLDRAKDFISGLDPDTKFKAPILGVGSAKDPIGFEDGRHRFAAMRDLGVRHAPVSLDPESYRNAKKRGFIVAAGGKKIAAGEPEERASWAPARLTAPPPGPAPR